MRSVIIKFVSIYIFHCIFNYQSEVDFEKFEIVTLNSIKMNNQSRVYRVLFETPKFSIFCYMRRVNYVLVIVLICRR